MAKTSKPTSKPVDIKKSTTEKTKTFSDGSKGIIKEGYQPTNTVDTSNPPKQNTSDKKD